MIYKKCKSSENIKDGKVKKFVVLRIDGSIHQFKFKNEKIRKRDIKFFLLGVLTLFLIESVFNWKEHASPFKEGFDCGYHGTPKQSKSSLK
ncbi:hypothetical protein HY04_10695 [Kaistella antarctica]|uniref:Uncharacterized protein n=1 Tax=Kaistella antarctica TaxID=266748 RepID=A0ABR4TZR5_9FLAO|nr:hypothetical protein HY04_10695 [Kaistella antarctica]